MSARGRHPTGGTRRAWTLAVAIALLLVPAVFAIVVPDNDRAAASTRRGSAAARATAIAAPHLSTIAAPHLSNRASHEPAPAQATVTLASKGRAIPVPRSFFGLSTEYFSLPLYERDLPVFERVLSMLHVPGGGPLVLRIGGDSADRAVWSPRFERLLDWQFGLTPAWLRQTGAIVRGLGLRVILDMNLVTSSPSRAARWARAAEASLPRGSIVGFEIGNEPDLYTHRYWQTVTGRARLYAGFLPLRLSAGRYADDFRSYADLLKRIAPRVPLVGPVIANPSLDVSWVARLIAGAGDTLGVVSAHRYPLSACVPRRSLAYPTIARVLSEHTSAGVARSIASGIRLAHRARIPFRLTELNSVTCGGMPGVSDTFATALWAPDALFELLRAGADGVNIHIRANTVNGPFAVSAIGLYARPLLYGLLLFTRTLGPHSELVGARVHTKPSAHLKAWAVRILGRTLHVLLIDKGSRAVNINLNVPGSGPATVQRLLAPSVTSRMGVTLAGQRLSRAARWQGQQEVERVLRSGRGYRVSVPAYSAALVSVQLRSNRRSEPDAARASRARRENPLRQVHQARARR